MSAFVFNFVDLLTHGRSESQILYEVARDEIALRQITRQWFQRSALFSVLKEASRRKISVLLTTDHGSIHCNTPATVFAKRDASANLRYKFGEDLRAERPEQALLFPNEDDLRLPRRGRAGIRCSRRMTASSSIRPSCANIRAGIADRSCTAA